jgi:hypothetical protein
VTAGTPIEARTDRARAVEAVLGAVLVVGAAAALHRLGSGPLEAPPLTSIAEARTWADERDAPTIALAVARLGLLVVCYHLVVTTAVALAGRALGRPGWVRLADAATLPPFRGPARRLAGLGLSVAAAVAPTVPPVGAGPPPGVIATDLHTVRDGSPTGIAELHRSGLRPAPGEPTVTLEVLEPDGTGAADLAPVPDIDLGAELDAPRGADADPEEDAPRGPERDDRTATEGAGTASGGGVHVVEPGDHLWSIAERTLLAATDGAPSVADTADYWRAVLAANPHLVDPDLVYPGETIALPPLP